MFLPCRLAALGRLGAARRSLSTGSALAQLTHRHELKDANLCRRVVVKLGSVRCRSPLAHPTGPHSTGLAFILSYLSLSLSLSHIQVHSFSLSLSLHSLSLHRLPQISHHIDPPLLLPFLPPFPSLRDNDFFFGPFAFFFCFLRFSFDLWFSSSFPFF